MAKKPKLEVVENDAPIIDAPADAGYIVDGTVAEGYTVDGTVAAPEQSEDDALYEEIKAEPDPAPNSGDNVKKIFKAFMSRVDKYGKAAGQGDASLPALALEAVRMAADRVIGMEKDSNGEDDAVKVYSAFQQAKAKARGQVYEKESSFKQQVSKFRRIVELGAFMFDEGVDVIERAAEMHRNAGATEALRADMRSGSLYAFLVDVAREQNREEYKGLPISDEVMEAILFPAKAERKDDIERVKAVIKSLEKLAKGTKGDEGYKPIESDYITVSIDNMNELLCELDPNHRAELEKLAQVEMLAAQYGFKLTKKRAA
jgi:hypothetical protein